VNQKVQAEVSCMEILTVKTNQRQKRAHETAITSQLATELSAFIQLTTVNVSVSRMSITRDLSMQCLCCQTTSQRRQTRLMSTKLSMGRGGTCPSPAPQSSAEW